MPNDPENSEAETVRRAEAALKRMLNTPDEAHAPLKKKRKPSRRKAFDNKIRESA